MFSRILPSLNARLSAQVSRNVGKLSLTKRYFSAEVTDKPTHTFEQDTHLKGLESDIDLDEFDSLFEQFNNPTENPDDQLFIADDEGTDTEQAIRQVFQEETVPEPLAITIARNRILSIYGPRYLDPTYRADSDVETESEFSDNPEELEAAASIHVNDPNNYFFDGSIDTKELFQLSPENNEEYNFLNPREPPKLSYDHVKLVKNIDYSPLVARATNDNLFTANDVMTLMLSAPENFSSYLAKTAPSRIPYRYQPANIIDRTVDKLAGSENTCPLCKPDPTPERRNRIHYSNVELLIRYLNERGQLRNRSETSVCGKHQRRLRFSVKNARSLSLLSSVSNWTVPLSYAYPDSFNATYDQPIAQDELTYLNIAKNLDGYREHKKFIKDSMNRLIENDPILSSEQREYDANHKAVKKPGKGKSSKAKPTKGKKK